MLDYMRPHQILLILGGVPIYAHGVFFAVGAIFSTFLLERFARRMGLPTVYLAERCAAIFLAGIIGARVGYFIAYPSRFVSLADTARIWQGGLLSFTGIATAVLAASILFKNDRNRWLDLTAMAATFGWAVGRIGNYYAADSFGVQSPAWSAFYGRVPIQLFEAVGCLVIGIVTVAWYFRAVRIPGRALGAVVVGYALLRFGVDFWRDEPVWHSLHLSQWAAIGMLAVGLLWLMRVGHEA